MALSLIFPEARVVALDNLSEGPNARIGFDMTRQIGKRHGLNIKDIEGCSPGDEDSVITEQFNDAIDLAFIDA